MPSDLLLLDVVSCLHPSRFHASVSFKASTDTFNMIPRRSNRLSQTLRLSLVRPTGNAGFASARPSAREEASTVPRQTASRSSPAPAPVRAVRSFATCIPSALQPLRPDLDLPGVQIDLIRPDYLTSTRYLSRTGARARSNLVLKMTRRIEERSHVASCARRES